MSDLRRLLIHGLLALLGLGLVACGALVDPNPYVAVIDAGSSGSRVYLYQRSQSGSQTRTELLYSEAGGLAMSSFETNPTEAGPKGVQPLLTTLRAKLAQLGIDEAQVSIHLLATAGMRLVEQRNPDAAATLYNSVRNTLASSRMRVGRVETMSGQLEALYAWANANYLSGTFSGSGKTPVGIIEVGGASAQLAYVTSASAADSNIISVVIDGRSYRVYGISWLGLGQNEARRKMIESTASGGGVSNNACYPDNPSGAGGLTDFDADIGGYRIAAGRYNFDTCSSLYSAVLKPFNVGAASQGADFAATYLLGISSLEFALKDWKALDDESVLDDNLKATCEGTNAWGAKVSPFLGGSTNRFAQNSCANGTFSHTLMFGSSGVGVRPSQFSAVSTIDGQPLTWTQGFALIQD